VTSTQLLESACAELHELGFAVKASQLSTSGHVAAGVALSAREAGADLIVVASRRPGDWSSLINGSVGHDVLRQANRMVLLAPVHRRGSAGQTG
jgi:nucleotide-binding universal stress UspA family protein